MRRGYGARVSVSWQSEVGSLVFDVQVREGGGLQGESTVCFAKSIRQCEFTQPGALQLSEALIQHPPACVCQAKSKKSARHLISIMDV